MIEAPTEPLTLDPEHARVIEWRAWCLVSGGFPADEALRLAYDTGIDLHEALDLVGAGCPPELAARILR